MLEIRSVDFDNKNEPRLGVHVPADRCWQWQWSGSGGSVVEVVVVIHSVVTRGEMVDVLVGRVFLALVFSDCRGVDLIDNGVDSLNEDVRAAA